MPSITDPLPDASTRILLAAIECVALDGFHAGPASAIASRASVGNGTLFRHFPAMHLLWPATFEHATTLLSGSDLADPPAPTLHASFYALWRHAADCAVRHRLAFHYWRLYRATPRAYRWDSPHALQLGPFARVPHMLLESCGQTPHRLYDAWLMAAQWTAAVHFILATYEPTPGRPFDPEDGPTPLQTLNRAYEAWWGGIGVTRDAPTIHHRRVEEWPS